MKYEYNSVLKHEITGLIAEKRALGFKYETDEKNLRRLDKLAIKLELNKPEITKEFADEYIKVGPNEKKITSTHRVGTLRVLANYMIRHGKKAYVIPPLPLGSYKSSFVPYIFTDDELRKIFETADNYAKSHSLDGQFYPQRKKYPVILRILYSTGMRIGEVLSLQLKNIDFKNNTITILQAKNQSERVIPIHQNTAKLIHEYILEHKIFEAEQYVFENTKGLPISGVTVNHAFLALLRIAHIPHPTNGPRIHDFRHTFCVHRLRDWVLENRDITALFPYLCAYMGHADTRCTEYYLRLTADLYPDIVRKLESYYKEDRSGE